jgi:hypothetical protein
MPEREETLSITLFSDLRDQQSEMQQNYCRLPQKEMISDAVKERRWSAMILASSIAAHVLIIYNHASAAPRCCCSRNPALFLDFILRKQYKRKGTTSSFNKTAFFDFEGITEQKKFQNPYGIPCCDYFLIFHQRVPLLHTTHTSTSSTPS